MEEQGWGPTPHRHLAQAEVNAGVVPTQTFIQPTQQG